MNFEQLITIGGLLLKGLQDTLWITVSCFLTAFASGLVIAVLRRWLAAGFARRLLDIWVFVLRSVPVLVLLFLIYFGLPAYGFRPTPLLAMNLSLGLISGAYMAEVFRGSLAGVNPTEIEAALAQGFTRAQVIRYIEFPQMLRFSTPGLLNELTSILKSAPFAYTVGITEILGQSRALIASTMLGINIYIVAGLIYFCIYKLIVAALQPLINKYLAP